MARKRGGLAGLWDLPNATVLFRAVPSFALTRKTDAKCFARGLGSYRDVFARQIVPLLALYLLFVVNPSFPASDIHLLRDRFKVGRVETSSVSAQVVNLHSVRDRPFQALVCQPVRVERFGFFVDA